MTAPAAPVSEPQADQRSKWLTLGAMCFALFMLMLDNTVVNLALPTIQQHFNTSTAALEWIVNGYTLSLAMLMVTMGKLGDVYGRKRVFFTGLVLFTVASLACGLAPSLGWLIAFRVIQGLGGSIMTPGTLSIITATFSGKERGAAIGIWAGISGLGLAAGPIIGGALVQYVNWQSIFFVNVPIGILAFFIGTRVVRESVDPRAVRGVDVLGVGTLTPAIFALTLALIEGQGWGWSSGRILGLFVAAAVLLVAFVVVENMQAHPMVDFRIFRSVAFTAANAINFVLSFGMFGTIFFLALYMQNVLGYTAIQAGVRQLPATALIVVGAPLSGQLVTRFGGRPVIFVGLASLSASLFLLALRVTPHSSYSDLVPSLVLMGLGMGFAISPLSTVAMGAVERTKAGVASGVLNMMRQLGGVFGIALLGAIFANRSHAHIVDAVSALPVPDPVKAQIIASNAGLARGGGGTALANANPELVARIREAVLGGVVHGLTDAMFVGAAACLLGAALTLFLAAPKEAADAVPGEAVIAEPAIAL